VNGTADGNWYSYIYEVTTTGSVVKTVQSPTTNGTCYGTGILVLHDTIYVVDRMTQQIQWAKLEDWNFNNNPAFDLQSTRNATYGPRCLAYDSKLGQYLLSYTDFQGTSLNGSYVLFLDLVQGVEVNSVPVTDGEQVANIRGMEYDPRGAGNTAWITILNTAGSSKLVKIALSDGPSGAPAAAFTAQPAPIAFGSVDTGTTKTIHVELHNSGTADGSIKLPVIAPDSVYSLSSSESYPIVIKAGDSAAVDITFAPHSIGPRPAALIITSGSDNTQTSIPISGTATFAGAGVSPDAAAAGWSLELSPNPARDYVDLTVTASQSDIAELRIFDVAGREVRAIPLGMLSIGEHETELSTTSLPSGMYFVRMTGENGEVCTGRLTIER
ncbi:MAG TPA: T9SS type A sorting domain-containing protein, partial [Candidatus Kapabacteria bacterium]|nr:T9SS type A sorting domain-containing protein [Candidatus Kapabacteria bacterium]